MADMLGLVERLEHAVSRLEQLSAGSHRSPGDCGEVNGVIGGVAPSVEAFDKLMNGMVAEFLKHSRILAGDVETHSSLTPHQDRLSSEPINMLTWRTEEEKRNESAKQTKGYLETGGSSGGGGGNGRG